MNNHTYDPETASQDFRWPPCAHNQQAPVAQRATPGNLVATLIVIAAVAVAGATFLFDL